MDRLQEEDMAADALYDRLHAGDDSWDESSPFEFSYQGDDYLASGELVDGVADVWAVWYVYNGETTDLWHWRTKGDREIMQAAKRAMEDQ